MEAVLLLVQQIITMAPSLIQAGIDVSDLIAKARAVQASVAAPDDAAWAEVNDAIHALEAQLNSDPAQPSA